MQENLQLKQTNEATFSLNEASHDAEPLRKKLFASKGENAVKKLKSNNFDAYYMGNSQSAAKLLLSLIPSDSVIGVGDSHTIYSLDLDKSLKEKGCKIIPATRALNLHSYNHDDYGGIKAETFEETRKLLAHYLTANVFLLGANAITMKGEIVNVDGTGNRIAGSLYGADRIIVVTGINKLVPDEAAARERIRFIAAPLDNIKYGNECACVKTGVCPNCNSPGRICNITTILHKKPLNSDFHVIIIGENLGF